MPDFVYPPAPVLVETTGNFAVGATGVLRATEGGDPVQVWDLNDSPLASVVVGPKGAHQAFKADIAHGVLDFGSVLLPAISDEARVAALEAAELAATAVSTANSAVESVGASVAASVAAQQAAEAAADLVEAPADDVVTTLINGDTSTAGALRAASVAAVQDADEVAPVGQWNFEQPPTAGGLPLGGSAATLATYDATAGVNTARPPGAGTVIWAWPAGQATDPTNAQAGDLILRFAEL